MPNGEHFVSKTHHNVACTVNCGSRCYLAYGMAPDDDECPKRCGITIEEVVNDDDILDYLQTRAQELLQPGKHLRFLYMGTRRPTPELLFNDHCEGATGNQWLVDYGGDMRVYKGLILRTGHRNRVEVCNLNGHTVARGEVYTDAEYIINGGCAWTHKLTEDLADEYLLGNVSTKYEDSTEEQVESAPTTRLTPAENELVS